MAEEGTLATGQSALESKVECDAADGADVEVNPGTSGTAHGSVAEPKTTRGTVQTTLSFGQKVTEAPKTGDAKRGQARKVAVATVQAAAAKKGSPPKACIKSGWLEGKEGVQARTKGGTREIVTVVPCDDVPLEFWQRKGGRVRVPGKHPVVIERGYMFALKDGKERWAKGGHDLICTNCFMLIRSPPQGEENLKTHFESAACGAPEWAKECRKGVKKKNGERDRRQPVDAGELTVSREGKLELHVETAMMFAAVGTLPASLFDNQLFINWVFKVSKESYLPPCSKFVDSEGPVMACFEAELVKVQIEVIKTAVEWFKGVAFMHVSFDAWTSRMGFPFLGLCLTFLTPWNLTRSLVSDPWAGEPRFSIATKLIYLTGRHKGENIAVKVAERLAEYTVPMKRITLHADQYDEVTDASAWVASAVTDSGGGVPAACRRLGLEHGKCNLHGLDTVLLWMFGLGQKTCPPELRPINELMKKVFALAAHFHKGDCVQRVAKHKKIQESLVSLKAAMNVLGSGLWDADVQAEAARDDNSTNEFLDPMVENPEEFHGMERVIKHVVHGKTRCWSTVDSAASIFELRLANNQYFDEFVDESHMNLTPSEYKDLQCMLGVAFEITDVERYVEVSCCCVCTCANPH